MSAHLPFAGFKHAGDAFETDQQLQEKVRALEVAPFVYSTEAPGDFEPVPISAAQFIAAVEAGWQHFSDPDAKRPPFQIMIHDQDARRRRSIRRGIRVAHWVYVSTSPQPDTQPSELLHHRPAPDGEIRKALHEAWQAARQRNDPPYNVKTVAKPARAILNANHLDAAERRISDIAGELAFAEYRQKPGVTNRSRSKR